jgi:nitric oxide reductase NorD protein
VPREDATSFVYPEWDHRRQAYRMPGCVLRELEARAAETADPPPREHTALLERVRRQLEAVRPRPTRLTRRLEGDGIDVDGWVEELAERRAERAPAGRLYTQECRNRRDVAVGLLLDASGSTDAWVSGSRRVIDVAKQAALCFGEALAGLGDRLAVQACSGRGPGDVRVWVQKRFEEPWSERVRARIAALEPDRFTRLGGPIRHLTASLCRTRARLRLLLLLSDGKPNDEDEYEGEHGIEDVRQAILEARAQGVRPFCLTIDREGSAYLPRIFGPFGYTVLWKVEQLPLHLPRIHRRLTSGAT